MFDMLFRGLFILLSCIVLLGGCGATATLAPENEKSQSFDQQFEQAVWLSDEGDHRSKVFFDAKDSLSIALSPETPTVQGAYWVSFADQGPIQFSSSVGYSGPAQTPVTFKLLVQRGAELQTVGETRVDEANRFLPLEADLSKFQGQEVIFILVVSTPEMPSDSLFAYWNHPRLFYP